MHVVETEAFSGPLDLLLELINRHELEISTISLSEITSDYLTHLEALEIRHPSDLAAFLSVAARLVALKSRLLLHDPEPEVKEDGLSLEEQLRLYQHYRDAATALATFRQSRGESLPAASPELTLDSPFIPITPEEFELLPSLFSAAIAQRLPILESTELPREQISLAERSEHLNALLTQQQRLELATVLDQCRSRHEVIVTFLALLELLRRRLGSVSQSQLFGAIIVEVA